MIGVPTAASMGRRLLDEAPDFRDDATFARMCGVLDSGRPEVVEVVMASGDGPIRRVRGSSCTGRSRSGPTGCSIS